MSASLSLTLLLWSAAGVIFPAQGQNSKRTDDENPLVAVVDKLSRDLLAVKAQLEVQRNQASTDLATVRAQMEAQGNEMRAQLRAQENEIASLKAAEALKVAFSAYISDEPRVYASAGSVAPFRGIITNVGGGYSTVTSAFTAPVLGQYFFIVHADCSADFRSLVVTVNGRRVFAADNDHGDYHVTGSGLVTLQKGDVVLTMYPTSAGYLDAENESTFTGFLVK